MKKQVLFLLFSLVMITASAQKMVSNGFTVSIKDLKNEKYSVELFGSIHHITEYTGDYFIKKGGKRVAAQKFTLMIRNNSTSLNIRTSEDTGNTLLYDDETQTFEFAGEDRKAKDTTSRENLILSGILIYAQWMDSEE